MIADQITKTPSKQVHFTIDPDWLTGFIRDLWSEGSYEHAYKVLDTVRGFPPTQWADLLAGKVRFTAAPGDPDSFMLAPDDWQADPSTCHYCVYPDPYKGLMYALDTALRAREKRDQAFRDELDREHKKAVQYASLQVEKRVREKGQKERLGTRESLMDGLIRQQLETLKVSDRFYDYHDENGIFPDTEFGYLYGFITPEGDFYGCPYFAHNALLSLLGKADDYQDCPDGWLKISRDTVEKHPVVFMEGTNSPNDKQMETFYAWAKKHALPIEKVIKHLFLDED